MNSSNFRLPKYCLHKSTGQAFVTIRGKRIYLGIHGSEKSRVAYEKHIKERVRHNDQTGKWTTSINRLAVEFIQHAETYYVAADGTQTPEVNCYRQALRSVLKFLGNESASDFGPKKLAIIQNEFADRHVRTLINRQVSRVRSVVGWLDPSGKQEPKIVLRHVVSAAVGDFDDRNTCSEVVRFFRLWRAANNFQSIFSISFNSLSRGEQVTDS